VLAALIRPTPRGCISIWLTVRQIWILENAVFDTRHWRCVAVPAMATVDVRASTHPTATVTASDPGVLGKQRAFE
jgi:hypothetical protein